MINLSGVWGFGAFVRYLRFIFCLFRFGAFVSTVILRVKKRDGRNRVTAHPEIVYYTHLILIPI